MQPDAAPIGAKFPEQEPIEFLYALLPFGSMIVNLLLAFSVSVKFS
jgi:hypothetical protein